MEFSFDIFFSLENLTFLCLRTFYSSKTIFIYVFYLKIDFSVWFSCMIDLSPAVTFVLASFLVRLKPVWFTWLSLSREPFLLIDELLLLLFCEGDLLWLLIFDIRVYYYLSWLLPFLLAKVFFLKYCWAYDFALTLWKELSWLNGVYLIFYSGTLSFFCFIALNA